MKTQRLYRPIGLKELELILSANPHAYPPRLSWQPIFYPVLNFDYAAQIAHDWNTKDAGSGFCGFVTEFEISSAYLQQFEVQNVGGHEHNELWIPAEQLQEFNGQIVGEIKVTAAFYGKEYVGKIESSDRFNQMDAKDQYSYFLKEMENGENLQKLVQQEWIAVQANMGFWKQIEGANDGLLEQIEIILDFGRKK
ncbi:MAG: hypothetical protein R3E32_14955 [Chitinophagales bacterium]